MTKTDRLFSSLARGTELTPNQIYRYFNLRNPSASINDLRRDGLNIRTKTTVNSRGQRVTRYRLAG